MRKSILLVFALMVLFSNRSLAFTLSPEQSLARIQNTIPKFRRMVSNKRVNPLPAYTALSKDSVTPTLYAFNLSEGGYVVTSAHDCAAPMLAYSEHGCFDINNISPSMKWWIGVYSEEISGCDISNHTGSPLKIGENRQEKEPIEPMVKTLWNQGDPYNQMCPEMNGKKTYTGCVATAQAQLMKYFNYPTIGKGKRSYIWNGQSMSMDFSETAFNWENMTNTYGKSSTQTQKDAVAYLMKACGYSVDMDYGTNASSAVVYEWAPSLINYFGYAPSSTPYNRMYYGLYQWEDMVYGSLKAGSPVLYAGSGSPVAMLSYATDTRGMVIFILIGDGVAPATDIFFFQLSIRSISV